MSWVDFIKLYYYGSVFYVIVQNLKVTRNEAGTLGAMFSTLFGFSFFLFFFLMCQPGEEPLAAAEMWS